MSVRAYRMTKSAIRRYTRAERNEWKNDIISIFQFCMCSCKSQWSTADKWTQMTSERSSRVQLCNAASFKISIFNRSLGHLPTFCGLQLLATRDSPLYLLFQRVTLSSHHELFLEDNIKTALESARLWLVNQAFSPSVQSIECFAFRVAWEKKDWCSLCVAQQSALNYWEKVGRVSILISANVHQEDYIHFC